MLATSAAVSLLCLALAVPTGCAQSTAATPPSPGQSSVTTPVPSTVVLSLAVSGFTEPTETVVRDPRALAEVWKTAYSGIVGNPAPAIDFSKQMVVLVALGERRTGGYSVHVDSVSRVADGARVRYTVVSPDASCMTTQMITAPVVAVAVPRMSGSVHFERGDVVQRC